MDQTVPLKIYPDSIQAPLTYSVDTGDKPVNETMEEGNIERKYTGVFDVHVMTILNGLNAPARLGALIGGESLVNDGSAMVVFFVFYQHENAGQAIVLFVRLVFGAVAIAICGLIFLQYTLTRTRNSTIELVLMLAVVFGCYFICSLEDVDFSGILCVVMIGFGVAARGLRVHYGSDVALDELLQHGYRADVEPQPFSETILRRQVPGGAHRSYDRLGMKCSAFALLG